MLFTVLAASLQILDKTLIIWLEAAFGGGCMLCKNSFALVGFLWLELAESNSLMNLL